MGAEKCGGVARRDRAEELEELVARVGRKAVGRIRHDVGVDMFREVESNRHATRIGVGIIVGDHWYAGGIGKAYRYRSGWALGVRSAGQRPGVGRRGE